MVLVQVFRQERLRALCRCDRALNVASQRRRARRGAHQSKATTEGRMPVHFDGLRVESMAQSSTNDTYNQALQVDAGECSGGDEWARGATGNESSSAPGPLRFLSGWRESGGLESKAQHFALTSGAKAVCPSLLTHTNGSLGRSSSPPWRQNWKCGRWKEDWTRTRFNARRRRYRGH